jgi:hypothetical protein
MFILPEIGNAVGMGRREAKGLNNLVTAFFFEVFKFRIVYPVNTVHGAGVNRLLDDLFGIAILPHHPRSPMLWLNVEGVAGNVGTVLTANARHFVHIHGFFPEDASQFGLISRAIARIPKISP